MIIKQIPDFRLWLQSKGFKLANQDKEKESYGFINQGGDKIIQIMRDRVDSFTWDGTERTEKPDLIETMYIQFKKEIFPKDDNTIPVAPIVLPGQKSDSTQEEIKELGVINNIPAILDGRIITPQDIEEWKKKTVFERLLFFQKTPKNLIKYRRGYLHPEFAGRDKKTLTDEHFKMFQYVPINSMITEANICFLFEWSAVIESEKYFESSGEVAVRGYVQAEINGKLVRKPAGGSGIKKGQMDWGDALETATSEMIKRGLKKFGFNRDVYSGESDEQKE